MPVTLDAKQKLEQLFKDNSFARTSTIELREEDSEGNELTFSFASETPYRRWFGNEIIVHEKDSGDHSRLNDGGAWLFNHNRNILLGSTVKAWIENRRSYVTTRWSSKESVKEYRQDIEDGHLRSVSFAYDYVEWEWRGKEGQDDEDLYVTKWRSYEVSSVTIPADASVGVGRSDGRYLIGGDQAPRIFVPAQRGLTDPQGNPLTSFSQFAVSVEPNTEVKDMAETPTREELRKEIRDREKLLEKIADAHNCRHLLDAAKDDFSVTPEAFRELVLKEYVKRQADAQGLTQGSILDLSKKDRAKYSVCRAIAATLQPSKKRELAPFEMECSDAIAEVRGKTTLGDEFYIPHYDLSIDRRSAQRARSVLYPEQQRATYEVQTDNVGGVTVETSIYPDMIDFLRNVPLISQFGARSWTGLEGNLDVLKQLTFTTVGWIGEDEALPEGNATFGFFPIRPKDVGAWSRITRRMLQQASIDIENFVREELMLGIALEHDRAAIHGSGVGNEPRGVVNTPGIGSVVLGVDGDELTWADIVQLETLVAVENALMSGAAYMTTPHVRGKLKTTPKSQSFVSEFCWTDTGEVMPSGNMGTLNSYKAGATNQVRSDLTKGAGTNLSTIIFGVWSEVICAYWDGLKVSANPYGNDDFIRDAVKIKAIQTEDIQVGRPNSFAAATDVVTTP